MNDGRYSLETNLERDKNSYYLVASIKSDSRRARIISTAVNIQGINGETLKNLEAGDLRSIHCNIFVYCKEQILKGFSINENGSYKLEIIGFKTIDSVEILNLSLHSNHSILFQSTFILIGFVLLIIGKFMILINLCVIGYNKLLQQIKESFAF